MKNEEEQIRKSGFWVFGPATVDPKTPRAKQDFGEFRMQFVGPGF